MGCGASNSRLNKAVTVESQESLLSTVNNTNEARDMLAKIRILNPVQRRRARSVGLPEENGVYWVYWRPVRAQGKRSSGEYRKRRFMARGLGKATNEVKKFMNFSRTPVCHLQ